MGYLFFKAGPVPDRYRSGFKNAIVHAKGHERNRHTTFVGVRLAIARVGGVDYMTKPYELDEMISRIETHL